MNTNPKVVVIEESSVMVPSQIGFGTTETGMLSRGFLKSPRTNLPYKVKVNGREYLAGPNVEMYATPLQRMDFARLGDSAEQCHESQGVTVNTKLLWPQKSGHVDANEQFSSDA